MINSCILALWHNEWDSVWDIRFGPLPILCLASAQPEYNLQLLLLDGSAFIFIPYLLWTLCVPVAHLFCSALRGIQMIFLVDRFILILQKNVLCFPWLSFRCFTAFLDPSTDERRWLKDCFHSLLFVESLKAFRGSMTVFCNVKCLDYKMLLEAPGRKWRRDPCITCKQGLQNQIRVRAFMLYVA